MYDSQPQFGPFPNQQPCWVVDNGGILFFRFLSVATILKLRVFSLKDPWSITLYKCEHLCGWPGRSHAMVIWRWAARAWQGGCQGGSLSRPQHLSAAALGTLGRTQATAGAAEDDRDTGWDLRAMGRVDSSGLCHLQQMRLLAGRESCCSSRLVPGPPQICVP